MKLLYFLLCLSYANSYYINDKSAVKVRIIGGEVTKITAVPYQASFEYEGKHKCGATILSKSWLLSAGHCFHGKTEIPLKGKVRIATSRKDNGGELLNITRVVVHPGYNHEEFDNDIALIEVTPIIHFNATKKPIEIVNSDEIPQDGQLMTISGYGRPSLREDDRAPFLKVATVRIIDEVVCAKAYIFFDPITNNMFCAESNPNDACIGDSGGPGVINGKLAGVISNGYNCATGTFPGVYTKVYKYHDWIVKEANLH